MKKLFIKLAKILGFEIIDQNNFSSPTLNKGLDEDLSTLNKKSIVLPLGEVKITRKVKSILIIIRMNTDIEIWDQNKKRLFEQPKIEYSYRSINSLVKSINFCQNKYPNLKIKTIILNYHGGYVIILLLSQNSLSIKIHIYQKIKFSFRQFIIVV